MSWLRPIRRWTRKLAAAPARHPSVDGPERHRMGNAVYIGNNRVLLRCVVRGAVIAYYLEADDRLLTPWFIASGEYETPVTNYLLDRLRPDSHCIDVGANFGYYTCLMARFCPRGRVVGIEADAHVHALVRDNIAINGLFHAEAIHAAAGAEPGELTLFRRSSRSGNTSVVAVGTDLTELLGEPPVQPFTVRTVRVDDVAERLGGRVDLIKMDVEGAEPMALAGSRATVAANPQLVIVMEWSPGQITCAGFDLRDLTATLDGMGLDAFDLRNGREVRLSWDDLVNLPYRAGIVLRRR